eukprot:TRINITY_DN752_c0_g1_i6.p1 TRINITY_DN752_c0_g1~~TRINITY_DN752_c0_g1_i6.p1  ORF type:complete len:231 (-),score=15.27 TRINITY_DN752_c0_g1_i6:415-1107(-)
MSDSEAELALALPLPDSQSSSSSHDSTTTAPPVTAEQYLRRVRTEASKLPSTFVASSIQSTEVASNATSLVSAHRIVPYPPYLSPVPQSRSTRLICFFCSLQKRVLQAQKQHAFHSTVKIPAVTDVNGLQHLLDQSSQGPLLSIVLRLDFLRVLRLLTIIHSQLQQVPDHYDSKNERHQQVASQLLQSFFAQRRDQWLFALFTLIQPYVMFTIFFFRVNRPFTKRKLLLC